MIPVIDFSKLQGDERAKTLAQIANGCEEWGFFQVSNQISNGIFFFFVFFLLNHFDFYN